MWYIRYLNIIIVVPKQVEAGFVVGQSHHSPLYFECVGGERSEICGCVLDWTKSAIN